MLNGSFWLEADSTREAWHNYDRGSQGKEGKEGRKAKWRHGTLVQSCIEHSGKEGEKGQVEAW